ncbi:MAG: potassium-transporting ATPase subunit KdpC [Acidobacteria bacterium]|nr:potassium-transporting ATPase subunit KdpC [Acidobacteriota bacterium]MCI0627934.1 potassium-transporting ATPase subunit KdpC [Acidobacteriota bacterium]MCI0719981.1 potassium-transporting ATPase subunit KdpC [Acidobacteriota bacterium]
MNLLKHLYPAVAMTIVLTVLTGILYPYAVTGLAYVLFKDKAQGSLIVRDGKVVGSRLIGQPFTGAGYFHSRPSAAGSGYDGTASAGTNLGPTSKKLIEQMVKPAAEQRRAENPNSRVPIDLVTASASGLDPHITPASAEFQVPRISRERKISEDELRQLVRKHTEGRQLGILGEAGVNVLELNLELDQMRPVTFGFGKE